MSRDGYAGFYVGVAVIAAGSFAGDLLSAVASAASYCDLLILCIAAYGYGKDY